MAIIFHNLVRPLLQDFAYTSFHIATTPSGADDEQPIVIDGKPIVRDRGGAIVSISKVV
jgi:hypothetical protein